MTAMTEHDAFPNGHLLISPAALKERLGEENLVIVDVRPTADLAKSGWIPGAAHLDLYGLGITRTTPELFEEWITMMRSLFALRGVGMDRTVVIYENTSAMRAARAFWILEYLGHTDVHVLDGGLDAWQAVGFETTHEMSPPKPRSLKAVPRPEIFTNADDLNARLGEPGLVPLDTRSDDEYFARHVRSARGGTIPGSVHLEWTNYLDKNGNFKPAAELAALFEGVGITRDKAIVPF